MVVLWDVLEECSEDAEELEGWRRNPHASINPARVEAVVRAIRDIGVELSYAQVLAYLVGAWGVRRQRWLITTMSVEWLAGRVLWAYGYTEIWI